MFVVIAKACITADRTRLRYLFLNNATIICTLLIQLPIRATDSFYGPGKQRWTAGKEVVMIILFIVMIFRMRQPTVLKLLLAGIRSLEIYCKAVIMVCGVDTAIKRKYGEIILKKTRSH